MMTELTNHIITNIGCINLIAPFTIFPYVFNRRLIPRIEKQLGTKMYFGNMIYDMMWGSHYYARYFEVSYFITVKYIAYILGFNANRINFGPAFALQNAEYKIEQAPKSLIIWSIIGFLNAISFFVCGWILIHYS